MSDYISINVKECTPAACICHNSIDRGGISYLVTTPNTVSNYRHELSEFNENATNSKSEIYEYFTLRKAEINQDYKENNKRSIQKNTKLYQEAVISFGRERFEQNNQENILKNIDKFCNNFEQKYNVKILMSSLHLDEGHKDINGKIQHNYHAHLLIENYSLETHKTGMRKVDFRTLQTDLANDFQELGFIRGDPERKAQRLEHKEYRAVKEHESIMVLENNAFQTELKKLERYQNNAEFFNKRVGQLQTQHREDDKKITYLTKETKDLKSQLEQLTEEYKKARQELKDSGEAKQSDYQILKQEKELAESNLKNLMEFENGMQPIIDLAVKVAEEQGKTIGTYQDIYTAFTTLKDEKDSLKTELQILEDDYKRARQELKNSGEAKQFDYQELKKQYQEQQNRLKATVKELETSLQSNKGLESRVIQLEAKSNASKVLKPKIIQTPLLEDSKPQKPTIVRLVKLQKASEIETTKQYIYVVRDGRHNYFAICLDNKDELKQLVNLEKLEQSHFFVKMKLDDSYKNDSVEKYIKDTLEKLDFVVVEKRINEPNSQNQKEVLTHKISKSLSFEKFEVSELDYHETTKKHISIFENDDVLFAVAYDNKNELEASFDGIKEIPDEVVKELEESKENDSLVEFAEKLAVAYDGEIQSAENYIEQQNEYER